jgi:pSer/pThr/pTyr-binding forkhead associated (FHA) protein
MVKLIIFLQNQRHGVDLKDGVYRLGREKPADIVVPDSTISANHAEIQVRGNSCRIRDLGSRNGTTVNGQPAKTATPIRPSDDVLVGGVKITIEIPEEVKPLPAPRAASPSGATAKMAAVKVASGNLSWAAKNWIAGAQVVAILLILFVLLQLYSELVNAKVRRTDRYKSLASQYVNVLSDPDRKSIPAPFIDESMRVPLYVTDRDGKVLYPPAQPDATPKPSPMIDSTSGKLWQEARWGLFDVPPTKSDSDLKSYPVRSGGDTLGFVVARPGTDAESELGRLLLMFFVSALIAFIILFFRLKPIHQLVRSQIEVMRLKISPLFNGFLSELPRSTNVPELNGLADEIEKAYAASRAAGEDSSMGRGKTSNFAPLMSDLLDTAKVPYCFVDNDFNVVALNSSMAVIDELSGAALGKSIFESGMTNIQSKQLVQCFAEARRSGTGSVRLSFNRRGKEMAHDVGVRLFGDRAVKEQVLGIVVTPAPEE